MPPSRSEFLEHQAKVMNVPKASIDTALGMIKTAAVSFEHLTGNEHWDRFLSMVQGCLDEAKKERDMWLLVCANEGDITKLRDAQLAYQVHSGRVSALEEVVLLPRQLVEQYKGLK
ncbi:MAG: hypothetical protein ABL983_00925 [Nitrospira sp.]